MNFYDVIEKVAAIGGKSLRTISGELNHRPNYLSDLKAKNRDTSVSNAVRILKTCGYGLFAMPLSDAPKDALRITPNETDQT